MRALTLAIATLLARPALADAPKGPHPEGDYGGVTPGQVKKPEPSKKPKKPPSKGTLSWVGFESKGGGSRVFLQSIAAFDVAQHLEGGALVVELGGLSKLGANTWRPIDTRFFEGPVARVAARHVGAAKASKTAPAHGAGIEVRISFKDPKAATQAAVSTATEADGFFYAYLDFAGAPSTGGGTMQEPEK